MKTKLYHKVIKLATKEICSDVRPSVQELFFRIYISKINYSTSTPKIFARDKREQPAMFAFIAWTEKVGLHSEYDRYSVKSYVREKYKRYSRKYWTSYARLKRIIAFGNDK